MSDASELMRLRTENMHLRTTNRKLRDALKPIVTIKRGSDKVLDPLDVALLRDLYEETALDA